jgi:CheY-like chemotaxis protein
MAFVPAHRRSESLPCHHIPLNASGETIAAIEMRDKQYRPHRVVKDWLQAVIGWVERARAENQGLVALLLYGKHDSLGVLRFLLESLGVSTLGASTCAEAWDVLESVNQPRLLFTEPILSDGTWSDVLHRLKETGTTAIVIVVSRGRQESGY